jgi:hypothetical protein
MAGAWVVEVLGDDTCVSRGFFEFVQFPTWNDRITLPREGGGVDVLGVIHVEHAPAPTTGAGAPQRNEPTATVYVHWIAEDDLDGSPSTTAARTFTPPRGAPPQR